MLKTMIVKYTESKKEFRDGYLDSCVLHTTQVLMSPHFFLRLKLCLPGRL